MNHLKKIMISCSLTLFAIMLTACAAPSSPEPKSGQASTQTIVIKDREGKELIFSQMPQRLISMAPSITQTLLHLGVDEQLIAVDQYSLAVPGINEKLPAFDMMSPDTERLVVLKPELILATGMSKASGNDPFAPVTDLGVRMTYLPSPSSLQGIKEDLLFLGQVTDRQAQADTIVTELETGLADLRSKIGADQPALTVYFEIAEAPSLTTFGSGTYLNEAIEMLGGSNIFADQQGWVSVSEEVILQKNPDIIFTNLDYLEDPVAAIANRKGWESVSAVKNQKVFAIDHDASSLPNENVIIAITQMAEALYPEVFQ